MASKKKKVKLSIRRLAAEAEAKKKFDSTVTQELCLEDIIKLQRQHPFESVSRDFYRLNGSYSESTWTKHFGTFAQFKRKSGLEKSRLAKQIENNIALHSDIDAFRKFYDKEVKPYHGKYERVQKSIGMKTLLIGSDFHDKDVDPFMLSVFLDTAKRLQPDHIILNGDIFDNYEFSRFYIDPRQMDVAGRFNFVKEKIFAKVREACPSSEIDMLVGNHEFRLMKHLADKSPGIKALLHDVMGLTLADIFGLDKYKINLIAKLDLGAYKTGDVNNELKQNFKVYYDCFTVSHEKDWGFGTSGTSGHTHKPALQTMVNVPLGKLTWSTTGCMALTEAEYIEGKSNYVNGFGLVHIDPNKKRVVQENIVVTGDFAAVAGQYYYR